MKQRSSLLMGAALALLVTACSESPTAPREVAPSIVSKAPETGPVFTVNPGSLESGQTPPGGVTVGGSGTAAGMGGQLISYTNIKSGNFSFLAWTPAGSGIAANISGGMIPLFYQGISGGDDDGPVLGAVWSGSLNVMINGEIVNVPLRAVVNASGLQPVSNFDTLALPPVGAVAVIPGTDFTAHIAGEAFYKGMWLPMSSAFTTIVMDGGQLLTPSLSFSPAFIWKLSSCDAGSYLSVDAGSCQPAEAGSYSAGGFVTSAIPCATGTYQPDTGQSSCIDADAGYYVNQTGQTSQTACGTGKYQPDAGQYGCLSAPPGSYASGTAQTSVTECSPGYFASGYGNTSCTAAPRGTYVADSGAANQTACAAGTYNNSTGQTSCQLAPAGYYVSGTGAFVPTKCAAGSYSSAAGNTTLRAASSSARCRPIPKTALHKAILAAR